MAGGSDLLGAAVEPRKRGRPKGSTNKRAADLKGYIAARFGGSAAQQAAQLAMVTPAELKAAGGSMAKAQVNKALDLVKHVREAQDGRDEWLRRVIREELADLADLLPEDVRQAVGKAVGRIREATAGFGLKEALDLIGKERAALLPYTDQRQPLAVDVTGMERAPSVVVMGMADAQGVATMPIENADVFEGAYEVVSQPKSHEGQQALEFVDEPGRQPAD